MPRKSSSPRKQPRKPIITLKIDPALDKALRDAVKKNDTDISKFSRQALREKLASLGI
jgi:hypothetical protein